MRLLAVVAVGHEWRRAWRDRALPLAVLAFLALLVVASWTSHGGASVRRATAEAVAHAADSAMAARIAAITRADASGQQPNADFRRLTGVRRQPTLMVGPHAFLTPGVSEWYPQQASFLPLSNRWTIFDDARSDLENPDVRASGRLDPAGIVTFVLPLLLLALLHDARTVDRELGVDTLLNAQPASPRLLLLARVGVWGVVPLLVASLGVVAVTWALAVHGPQAPSAMVPLLAGALTWCYGLVWIGLALCVSRASRSSGQAVVLAGALWIVGVLVGPAAAALMIERLAPVSPSSALINAVRAATAIADAEGGSIRRSRTEQLPRDAPVEARLARMWQGQRNRLGEVEAAEQRVARLANATRVEHRERQQLAARLRWLSPATTALDAFHRLAGTDAGRALRFQDEALRIQQEMRALLREFAATEHWMVRSDYDRLPAYRDPGVEVRPVAVSTGLLLLVAVLLLVPGLGRTRRRASS